MAEETIQKPVPPRVESWRLPKSMIIESDGHDPRSTRLLDAATGEKLNLPAAAIQFNVTAHEPSSMVITLDRIALRAEVHHIHVEIEPSELAALARMNGFAIVPVPAYPARVVSYGPAEHQVLFRDFPELKVTKANPVNQKTLRMAEEALAAHLDALDSGPGFSVPPPSEVDEGAKEFLIHAHRADPEFEEILAP